MMVILNFRKFSQVKKKYIINVFIGAILAVVVISPIHSFLATNKPVDGNTFVVEGWLPDSILKLAASEFNKGQYIYIIIIGGTLPNFSLHSEQTNYAESASKSLCNFGFDKESLITKKTKNYCRTAKSGGKKCIYLMV